MANSNGAFGLRPIGVVGQAANTTGMTAVSYTHLTLPTKRIV